MGVAYKESQNPVEQFYNELAAVPAFAETTIISHTVPAGTEFILRMINGTTNGDTIFRVKKNGVTIATRRSNWTQRNLEFFFSALLFAAGDVIALTAEHECSVPLKISGELYGN